MPTKQDRISPVSFEGGLLNLLQDPLHWFRVYGRVVRVGFAQYMAYPVGVLMHLVSYPIVILTFQFVYRGVYAFKQDAQIGGFGLEEMLTYVVIGYLMRLTQMTPAGRRIGERVREGQIAVELMKPVGLLGWFTAETLGRTGFRLMFGGIPVLIIFILSGTVIAPASLLHLGVFLVFVCLAWVINFLMDYMIGLSAFFFEFNHSIRWAARVLTQLLGGLMIPLSFFPEAVAKILGLLPPAVLYYTPLTIYLGKVPPGELWRPLGLALFWMVALYLAAAKMDRAGVRRLAISGG